VLGVIAATAYATLQVTPMVTAGSNPHILQQDAGRVIFSIRNTNPSATITINGFMPLMPATGMDCSQITTPVRLDGQIAPAVLAPNEQMQYIATTTGFATPGTYSCNFSVLTDDIGGPYSIETQFVVGSAFAFPGLDAQPRTLDFGSQTKATPEVQ